MTRMRLEGRKGTCDFAFPEGDLAYGGQEGICPTVHGEEGGVQRGAEASWPSRRHPSLSLPGE